MCLRLDLIIKSVYRSNRITRLKKMYVTGKVAVVTGGAIGLGFLYAKELLRNGLKGVTIADVNVEKGEESVKSLIDEYGLGKAIFVKTNITNKDEFEHAIKKTIEIFTNFDILINNAGIFNDSVWEMEIDVNLKGTINGCFLALEEYLPKYKSPESEPLIVNISSIAGLNPSFHVPVYCTTKFGIIALGKCLALKENSESQGVKVITVCPGITLTTILDNLDAKPFTSRHLEWSRKEAPELVQNFGQTPEIMAAAMIKIIENAQNGDIWVVSQENIFQVEVPNLPDLKILRSLE